MRYRKMLYTEAFKPPEGRNLLSIGASIKLVSISLPLRFKRKVFNCHGPMTSGNFLPSTIKLNLVFRPLDSQVRRTRSFPVSAFLRAVRMTFRALTEANETRFARLFVRFVGK